MPTTARLRSAIAAMLSAEHGYPATAYTWLERFTHADLFRMMQRRQTNTPTLFAAHGIYTM